MFVYNRFTSRLTTVTVYSLFAASFGGYRGKCVIAAEGADGKTRQPALSPDEFREFRLKSVENLSHNTKLYRFSLPSANHETGLVVARYVSSLSSIVCQIDIYPVYFEQLLDCHGNYRWQKGDPTLYTCIAY